MHGKDCLKHTLTCLYTVLINFVAFTGVNYLFVSIHLRALLYLLLYIRTYLMYHHTEFESCP